MLEIKLLNKMEETIFFDLKPINDSSFQPTLLLKWELVQDLSFPMNLSPGGTFLIAISLLLIICIGLVLRATSLAYLCEPDIHIGPINYLLWIDQLNGLVQLGVILVIIIGVNDYT
jgi:hypothetical protein